MKTGLKNDRLGGMMLPQIKRISNLEGLAKYKEEWKNILSDNQNFNPFLEFDWIENWWSYLGSKHILFVLIILMEDRVVGICPFMIIKRRFFQEITFIGYPEASYMDLILTREAGAQGIKAVMEYIKSLNGNFILHLFGLSENSFTRKALENYFKKRPYRFFTRAFEAPFLRMDGDFTTYFRSRTKHNSIRMLNKSQCKLEEAGSVIYKQLSGSEIGKCFQLHEKRWMRKYDASSFTETMHREFFRALLNKPNLSFQVSLNGLMIGQRLIAFTYGFLCNGTYYIYRICHDDDFSVYGPGKIILMKLIEDCFQKDVQVFDFGLGYARYKYEWTNDKKLWYEFIASFGSRSSHISYYKYLIRKSLIEGAKKYKYYDSLKLVLMGKIHCFFSGIYFGDMINLIRRIRRAVLCNGLHKFLIESLKSLYQYKEIMIIEIDLDHLRQDTAVCNKSQTDLKEGLIIKKAYINDLDILSYAMKEKPAQIIKHFYDKQSCFILEDGIQKKDYLWIDYKHIGIPDIKYQEDLSENNMYIDLTKVDVTDLISAFKTMHKVINKLHPEKCSKCYMGFNINKEELKNQLGEISCKPYKYLIYKKLLFLSWLTIK